MYRLNWHVIAIEAPQRQAEEIQKVCIRPVATNLRSLN
jgi:hypothetical protein